MVATDLEVTFRDFVASVDLPKVVQRQILDGAEAFLQSRGESFKDAFLIDGSFAASPLRVMPWCFSAGCVTRALGKAIANPSRAQLTVLDPELPIGSGGSTYGSGEQFRETVKQRRRRRERACRSRERDRENHADFVA